MFPTQSNTIAGQKVFIAGSDFTGLAGRVAKFANSAGLLVLSAIAALTDIPAALVVDENAAGKPVTGLPLDGSQNVRVTLKGACNPGDILVLADPATAADAGKVRALPAGAGVYVQVGLAEEIGVDGQLVLLRPDVKSVRVKSADTITGAADLAALKVATLAILQAQGLVV